MLRTQRGLREINAGLPKKLLIDILHERRLVGCPKLVFASGLVFVIKVSSISSDPEGLLGLQNFPRSYALQYGRPLAKTVSGAAAPVTDRCSRRKWGEMPFKIQGAIEGVLALYCGRWQMNLVVSHIHDIEAENLRDPILNRLWLQPNLDADAFRLIVDPPITASSVTTAETTGRMDASERLITGTSVASPMSYMYVRSKWGAGFFDAVNI